jgi:hypothetical protein
VQLADERVAELVLFERHVGLQIVRAHSVSGPRMTALTSRYSPHSWWLQPLSNCSIALLNYCTARTCARSTWAHRAEHWHRTGSAERREMTVGPGQHGTVLHLHLEELSLVSRWHGVNMSPYAHVLVHPPGATASGSCAAPRAECATNIRARRHVQAASVRACSRWRAQRVAAAAVGERSQSTQDASQPRPAYSSSRTWDCSV